MKNFLILTLVIVHVIFTGGLCQYAYSAASEGAIHNPFHVIKMERVETGKTDNRAIPPEVSGSGSSVPFLLEKSGTSIIFRFEWLDSSYKYHIYGVTDEGSMNSGAYYFKLCDLENNTAGSWDSDDATYIEWTLTDSSSLMDNNYLVVAENDDGEGSYGENSGAVPRVKDSDQKTPTAIGCEEYCDDIVINEIDSDTPGTDNLEFVELYNWTGNDIDLSIDNYLLVFFNGSDDESYRTIDLSGTIQAGSFFVIGNDGVVHDMSFANNLLQNGADAVALYKGVLCSISNGTSITAVSEDCTLVDAIVYDTDDSDDTTLLTYLGPTEQINESSGGDSTGDSIQRVLDGEGCEMGWAGNWKVATPSAGASNNSSGTCAAVSAAITTGPPDTTVCIDESNSFSGTGTGEGGLTYEWDFDYDGSNFTTDKTGSTVNYIYTTAGNYTVALRIIDSCTDLLPQQAIDTIPVLVNACTGPCPDIRINEIDCTQSGSDNKEFVELHNRTGASVDLTDMHYVLVFFNGNDDRSYYSENLSGTIDNDDFYLIGTAILSPDISFPDSTLQNGADAVALYRGPSCSTADIPGGTAAAQLIGDCTLVDAVCYDTGQLDDSTLMTALGLSIQINENENAMKDTQSIQRVTDSQGCDSGWSGNYMVTQSTPGTTNSQVSTCETVTSSIDSVMPDTSVCLGSILTFAGSGSGEGTLSYEWDFDYDGITFVSEDSGQSVEYRYLCSGSYTVAFRTTDSCMDPTPQEALNTINIDILECPVNCPEVVINEIDSDQAGVDRSEFVELVNVSGSSIDLAANGYVLVFFNGNDADNASYYSIDLSGSIADDDFYVIGNAGVSPVPDQTFSDTTLENGPDAVAIYKGVGCSTAEIPNGTLPAYTIGSCTLVDAICYDTGQENDEELMSALSQNEQFDEGAAGDSEIDSIQRILDGLGCDLGWEENAKTALPTPDSSNDTVSCCQPVAASIDSINPAPLDCQAQTFSFTGSGTGEGTLDLDWDFDYDGITFDVDDTGVGVSTSYASAGEYVVAFRITDDCSPPQEVIDTMPLIVVGCTGNCPDVTINEIDSDQAGTDTLEFIELHNDTGQPVDLATNGYVLVFFNGDDPDNASYFSIDLTGSMADGSFYLLGNTSVVPAPDQVFSDSLLQNGAEAVALYRGANCSTDDVPNNSLPGSIIGDCVLIDAICYSSLSADYDTELMNALGQTVQIPENAGSAPETHSIQRVTDSENCPMGWADHWKTSPSTPRTTNGTACASVSATILSIDPPGPLCKNNQQTFNGSGTGEGTLTYTWDFDYDGSSFSQMDIGIPAYYTYTTAGNYIAALKVTDSCSSPGPQSIITTKPVIVYDCTGNCPDITINEVDCDQENLDIAEFIELHNDSGSAVDLDAGGYVIAFFNGGEAADPAYYAVNLTGSLGDGDYFVIGNESLNPDIIFNNGFLQDGPDAIALYKGQNCSTADILNGTPAARVIGDCVLIDALCYDTNDDDDTDMMTALGQTVQIDENSIDKKDIQSIQRDTDSDGCPMGWDVDWKTANPSPGSTNDVTSSCTPIGAVIDSVSPGFAVCQGIEQSFISSGEGEGTLSYAWDFDYNGVTFTPTVFTQNAVHTYGNPGQYVAAVRITDTCSDPAAQEAIDTQTIDISNCTGICSDITINEIDSDTTGSDDQEFVELHNNTGAAVDLAAEGFVLVFFNGGMENDTSYYSVDLTGTLADSGYFTIGNSALSPDIVFPDDTLENGADAVALYKGVGCSTDDIPNGTNPAATIGDCTLVDAICYDTSDPDDVDLMAALEQTIQINENTSGEKDTNSVQRNTDSEGCAMGWSVGWKVATPSPSVTND